MGKYNPTVNTVAASLTLSLSLCFMGCQSARSVTPAPVPQAQPIQDLLVAVKTGDQALLKSVFSEQLQARIGHAGWKKPLAEYTRGFEADFGDFEIADFSYRFEGDAEAGMVFITVAGKPTPGGLLVIREGDAWKMNER